MKKCKILLVLLALGLCISLTACHTIRNSHNPEMLVRNVCAELGYEIISEDCESLDDAYYDGYVCQIALEDDLSMQVVTGFSGQSSSWASLTIYNNDVNLIDNKLKQLEPHYNLIVCIVNKFIDGEITTDDIKAFFEDDSNIVKSKELNDGLYYFIEKNLTKDNVVYCYSVYTSEQDCGLEHSKCDSLEEYLEITTIQN